MACRNFLQPRRNHVELSVAVTMMSNKYASPTYLPIVPPRLPPRQAHVLPQSTDPDGPMRRSLTTRLISRIKKCGSVQQVRTSVIIARR
jgi:hypothetical protein